MNRSAFLSGLLVAMIAGSAAAQEKKLKPLKELLSPEKVLPGLWAGATPGGSTEYMTFREDGKLLMVGPGGQKATYKWKCDSSEVPWKLDLVVNGDAGEATIYTVFDFPGEDSFRMAPPAADIGKRPNADGLKASKLIMKRIPFPPSAGIHQAVQAHLKGLSGTWQGITSGQKGAVTFTMDGRYTLAEGGEQQTGKFRIDVTKVPCGIDLLPDDGTAPKYGIYEIRDGTLRVGAARTKPEERATDFTGAAEFVRKK